MTSPSSSPRHALSRGRDLLHRFDPGGSKVLAGTTPAARITFSTPAAKPSSKNTIIPHGEVPSKRSISQPTAAPTKTAATSSVDSNSSSEHGGNRAKMRTLLASIAVMFFALGAFARATDGYRALTSEQA